MSDGTTGPRWALVLGFLVRTADTFPLAFTLENTRRKVAQRTKICYFTKDMPYFMTRISEQVSGFLTN